MRKNIVRIVSVIAVISLISIMFTGCKVEKIGSPNSVPVENGNAAPDFTAKMTDGSTYILSSSAGKVVILNFWATWCGPCCMEMPAFQRLYDEYGDKLQVLAINYAETADEVNDFIKENGYTFPFALDEDSSIAALYPTNGIPYTVIIDKEGNIVKTFTGAVSAEQQYAEYKAVIDEVLNGQA